jgi:hypothetical protein
MHLRDGPHCHLWAYSKLCHDRVYIMNLVGTFIAPFAKAERAKTQINDLDLAIKAFFEATPYEIVSEVYPEANEEVWRFQLKRKLPRSLGPSGGDLPQPSFRP